MFTAMLEKINKETMNRHAKQQIEAGCFHDNKYFVAIK